MTILEMPLRIRVQPTANGPFRMQADIQCRPAFDYGWAEMCPLSGLHHPRGLFRSELMVSDRPIFSLRRSMCALAPQGMKVTRMKYKLLPSS